MNPSRPSKCIVYSQLARILFPVLILALSGTAAQAATSEFRILINVDVNPTTGCDVTTPDGVFPGVEQMLVTTVETGASTGQVTLVERRECVDEATDTFGPAIPVSAGGWPVGVGLGLDGSDVVETFVGVSDVGGDTPPPVIRLGVVGDDGVAEDALLVMQPAGTEPILLELASILEIPTLSEWGLILLALLLATLALWQMRRMGRRSMATLLVVICLGVTVVAFASVRDGLIDDWLGVSPLAEDPEADAPAGADVRALFARIANGEICFRIDAFLEFNGPPDAVDDDFTVTEDSVGNPLDVLGNDDDPEMDPLTITAVGTPDQGGTATTDGTTISYTPAADFKGTETFTYTVDDGNGNTDTATVTVTVTNVNDPPDAVDDAFTVPEDSTGNPLDVLVNDTDAPDMGETLTITGVGTPDQGGSVSIVGGGTSLSYTPAADFAGTETFTYTLDDGNGGMDTATVTVTVTNVNDPPDALDDMFTVDEDSSDNPLDVLANDTDAPDTGETLTITGVGTPDQGGSVSIIGGGSSLEYTPAADFAGTETFTYTIDDGNGGMDTATVTVTVQDANPDPPVCSADAATTDEDISTLVDVLANDTDPDPGQTETLMVSAVDTTGTTGLVTNNGADVTYDPNGAFESLGDGDMATDTFSYTALDSDGLTCMATVTVTITGVNDAPMVVGEVFDVAAGNFEPAIGNTTLQFANADAVTTPDVFVLGDVLDNDSDPENDPVALTGFDAMSMEGGTVSLNLATGEFTYLPPVGFEGMDTFTYTVSDGTDTALGTVTIEVADMVWYIDNDPANDGAGDDGRSVSGFDSIAQFEAENGVGAADDPEAGDVIFVFQGTSTYDAGAGDLDGIDLLDQQRLLGEGVDLVVQGLTLVTGNPANQPSIDNSQAGGDAVTVLADTADRTGIEIRGLSIVGDDNAVEVTSANTFQVGVTISDNTIAGSGAEGLHFNPGSSGAFVTTVENNVFSTSSAGGNAIDLTTAAASSDVEVALNANTDVTSSGGAGIVLDNSAGGGDLFITGFAGNTVHGNTMGDGIRILNATFDDTPATMAFTEVAGGNTTVGVGNPVGGSAMVLTNVEGDLAFGALNLSTDGMGSVGLDVTGNGTLNAMGGTGFEITNTGGTISSTNGPAVVLDPLTAGLTFGSVTSTSSPTTGISLTDVAGSFTATTVAIDDTAGAGVAVTNSPATVTLNGGFIGETASTAATTGGNAVDVDGSSGNVTVAATITNTTGRSVEVTNHTGGATIAFSGAIDDDGAGVLLNGNGASGGATFDFTGGLDLATTTNDAFTATGGGTVNVADGVVTNTVTTTTGTGVNIANTIIGGTGITFDSVSTNGAANGILLANTGSGDFSASGGSIVNATNRGVDISGGAGNVTVGASISTTSTGRSVEVTGKSAGTVLVSAAVDDNGLGVRLDSNSGATLHFTGGLAIDTVGANTGFNATAGGTVNVTGTNTVNTTAGTGVGVNIANTTIGASHVTFRSVSADGASAGIVLDTTGSTGQFEVTGDGASSTSVATAGRTTSAQGGGSLTLGSGGTITNTTDGVRLTSATDVFLRNLVIGESTAAPGDAVSGTTVITDNGLEVSSVSNLVLDNVLISQTGDHGIEGFGSNVGLTLIHTEILNAGDNGAGPTDGDDAMDFNTGSGAPLTGAVLIQSSILAGMSDTGLEVENFSGDLDLTVTDSFIGNNDHSDGNCNPCEGDGFLLRADGGNATIDMVVQDTTFNDIANDGIDLGNDQATNVSTLVAENLAGTNNDGADNLIDTANTNGTLRVRITGLSSDSDHRGTVLFFKADGAATTDVTVNNGLIQGSAIGAGIQVFVDGDPGTGLLADGNARVLIENTDISNHFSEGVSLLVQDMATASGTLDATLDSVTTQKPSRGDDVIVGSLDFVAGGGGDGTLQFELVNSSIGEGSDFIGSATEGLVLRGDRQIDVACVDDGNGGNGTPCTNIGNLTSDDSLIGNIMNENGNQVAGGSFAGTDVFTSAALRNSSGEVLIISPTAVTNPTLP